MITVRKAEERGHFNHGWLDTYHSFSFGGYLDRNHMGFRTLRVINEDIVDPGQGFATHPHENMEIITYILDGELAHKDSLGSSSVISPGEIQRITAGTGITHSEFNHSQTEPVHLLQIWITPSEEGLTPSYDQRPISVGSEHGTLSLIASKDGRDESMLIHQDVDILAARMQAGEETAYNLDADRYGWLQVAKGAVELNGTRLDQGDGAKIEQESLLKFKALEDAELLLFDLA